MLVFDLVPLNRCQSRNGKLLLLFETLRVHSIAPRRHSGAAEGEPAGPGQPHPAAAGGGSAEPLTGPFRGPTGRQEDEPAGGELANGEDNRIEEGGLRTAATTGAWGFCEGTARQDVFLALSCTRNEAPEAGEEFVGGYSAHGLRECSTRGR